MKNILFNMFCEFQLSLISQDTRPKRKGGVPLTGTNMQINEIREKIIDTLYTSSPTAIKSLARKIELTKEDYKPFRIVLNNLEKTKLVNNTSGKYAFPSNYNIGYLQTFKKSENYIFFKNKKYQVVEDITNNAIHGDKVIFEIVDKYLQTVRIISTIKRKSTKVAGIYVEYNGIGFVVPDNDRLNVDIYVQRNNVKPNLYDRVLIKIDEYKIFGKPEGVIEKKLFEDLNKEESALERVLAKYDIPAEFPNDVVKKAISLNLPVRGNMLLERVDLRDENIFTIDGKDARDFDDAVSITKTEFGYELGVYIADVSYYVQENGVIDKCAFERGTSYYLDDYVVPMLPVALSNGACSLNEGEDKLVVGLKMVFDNNGRLINKDLFEGVVCSKKRFTYEEINAYLQGDNPKFKDDNKLLFDDLMVGFELAELLNKKRSNNGCIDFEFGELSFKRDTDKKIIDFGIYERGPANDLIEEFMIVANETIAELFAELDHPFIYRTHGVPFSEKLQNFVDICKENNIDTSMLDIENPTSKQLKELISNIEDVNLKKSINMNLITTMKQARYTKELDGHFGLASQYYCHFTSPIRRYPDLFIHRLVKKYIKKKLNNDVTRELYSSLSEKVAKHCCYTERNADRAEEELNRIQTMQYMADNPEREYSALIYGINKNGLLVLVNEVVSGFIRAKNNNEDGEVSAIVINDITYKIGDKINVSFKEYDVKNSKLIFEPLEG